MFSTNTQETNRWSDTLKRLRPQRYVTRISPFTQKPLSPKPSSKDLVKNLEPVKELEPLKELERLKEPLKEPASLERIQLTSPKQQTKRYAHLKSAFFKKVISESTLLSSSLQLSKKSQTCPNIVALDRPLPPLPSKPFSSSLELFQVLNKKTTQLKRAATWLGLPIQRILPAPPFSASVSQAQTSQNSIRFNHIIPQVLSISNSTLSTNFSSSKQQDEISKELIYGTDSDHFAFLRNQLEQKKSPTNTVDKKSIINVNKKTFVKPKRIMYCRVMQIINLASTRDCDYELHIQLNNVTLETKRGVLRKVEKNVSADRPQEEALVFEVEEPFSLNFIVAARHTNTVIRESLAKIGIWPIQPIPQKQPLVMEQQDPLPVAGFTCLNFENKLDILDQGVSRFRLTKPIDKSSNRWLNIELLIDIKVEEVLPAVVHRFPWSYTTNQYSAASYQSSDEDIVSDPRELAISQNHCANGDFLTLYTRGMAHPTWKRYWVTMEENQLILHDFTYKETKEPISIIPLIPLQAVSKPSVEDCENVGIARKTGILLQFDRNAAVLTEPVRLETDEGLDGKAYLFGDSEKNTIHWRRALSAYITDDANKNKTTKEGIDLRFLW